MRRPLPNLKRILRFSGGELSALRRFEGLSQYDLAELTGLHRNTIANLEEGATDPTVLAMSLIQIRLRAIGVFVENEGFVPRPSPLDSKAYAYPKFLSLYPAVIVRVMGQRIRARRRALGMSLAELSRACDLHLNTVWNLERGLVIPSASTIFRIYRRLDVRYIAALAPTDIELR